MAISLHIRKMISSGIAVANEQLIRVNDISEGYLFRACFLVN